MKKKIAIIGSGVVGSATGAGFLTKGHEVVFYDVQEKTIDSLRKKGYTAQHIDELDVEKSEAFFFVVPTPTEKDRINLTYLKKAAQTLGRKLKKRQGYFVVVVRSTVLPRTTEDLVVPIIEKASGKKAGRDFGVSMNPEYLREVSAEDDFQKPWLITIGSLDEKTKEFMLEIYHSMECPVHHVSLREAEMQKYVHNLYNAAKIAFFNEMRLVGHQLEINPDKIFNITADSAEGFWNKSYGLKDFGPFDGMCLPKDTQALLDWSKKQHIKMDLLGGVISANKKFKDFWQKYNKKVV
ncbi:MAG: nucleotide sugar dehydrogenase [Parcubacteria group bacterium]|jgi:UDPglucose 6-dehydrogenase